MKQFYEINIIVLNIGLNILFSTVGQAYVKNYKCELRRHRYITQDAIGEQYETESLAILPFGCQWLCFVLRFK
jgi:hypothetical protein